MGESIASNDHPKHDYSPNLGLACLLRVDRVRSVNCSRCLDAPAGFIGGCVRVLLSSIGFGALLTAEGYSSGNNKKQ